MFNQEKEKYDGYGCLRKWVERRKGTQCIIGIFESVLILRRAGCAEFASPKSGRRNVENLGGSQFAFLSLSSRLPCQSPSSRVKTAPPSISGDSFRDARSVADKLVGEAHLAQVGCQFSLFLRSKFSLGRADVPETILQSNDAGVRVHGAIE